MAAAIIMAVVQAAIGTAGSVLAYLGTEKKKDSLREQRMVEKRRTRIEQEQRKRRERALIGASLVAGAASGFEVGTGTSLSLLEEAHAASRREGRRIDYAGELALVNIDTAVDDLSNQQVFQIFNAATGTMSQIANAAAKSRTETKSDTQTLLDRRGRSIAQGASVASSSPTFKTASTKSSVGTSFKGISLLSSRSTS